MRLAHSLKYAQSIHNLLSKLMWFIGLCLFNFVGLRVKARLIYMEELKYEPGSTAE